jgi:predicted CXXCH cytochrome family protein
MTLILLNIPGKSFLYKRIILNFIIGLVFMVVYQSCGKQKVDNRQTAGLQITNSNFVGDLACKNCHTKEYDNWLGSHHDMAMKPANEETVLANFNNIEFEADGVKNYFNRKGEKFYVRIRDVDGSEQEHEIKYTFGWTPLQQYLVEFPGGRYQVLRVSWDVLNKKWFHQNEQDTIQTSDWLHWTNSSMTWNSMCADCHSTGYTKNYNVAADTFHSSFVWINVSCEACHGAGKKHVDLLKSGEYEKKGDQKGGNLFMTKNISSIDQVDQCAPCHSRRSKLVDGFHPGSNFNDIYNAQLISDEFYFPDGQILEEDYVYGSFVQSKMYHRGIKCTNCHDPHSLKLVKTGNDLCLQCHDTNNYPKPKHHFHKENSEATKCVNCHMTGRVYMGNDFRRDHSFRVPRPDQSVLYNTPNACNECHKDKDAEWAANQVKAWYGSERRNHFSDMLLKSNLRNPDEVNKIRAFILDTSYPEIARATAIRYLGQSQNGLNNETIHQVLTSNQNLIQRTMISSMPEIDSLTYTLLLNRFIDDSSMSVRMNTVNRMLGIDFDALPPSIRNQFERAFYEYQATLELNADFREGKLFYGNFYEQIGQLDKAIQYYKSAVETDSLFVEARLALAVAYNKKGSNELAMSQLKNVVRIDNNNSRALYLMGLLYTELKDYEKAAQMMGRAIELDNLNIDYYYNLGLIKQQLNKPDESLNLLRSALVIEPESEKVNYAIAYILINGDNWKEAKKYVSWLTLNFPESEEYKRLLLLVQSKVK